MSLRVDNSSTVNWINECRGGKEPRAGALMRSLESSGNSQCVSFSSKTCTEIDPYVADTYKSYVCEEGNVGE